MASIIVGKQYRLTMPNSGLYININRQDALTNIGKSGLVTIEILKDSELYGKIARIKENGYWVAYEHLAPLLVRIKYNKDKICKN